MKDESLGSSILIAVLSALLVVVGIFVILAFSYIGWSVATADERAAIRQQAGHVAPQKPTPAVETSNPAPVETTQVDKDSSLSFELTAGQPGDYGQEIIYNKGTEVEEKLFGYYVPPGQYSVTNTGKSPGQINVYSNEVTITDKGWEEPAEVFSVELLNAGESAEISVGRNQYIEISDQSVFTLTNISAQNDAKEPETSQPSEPVKTPEPAKGQTDENPSGATILPITPTIQPVPQTPSPGTAQQGSSGGGSQEIYPKDPSKGTYVGSIEKDIYHYPSCRYYDEILPEHLVWFDTVEKAVADGRRACKVCDPPLP